MKIKLPLFSPLVGLALTLSSEALSPGDLMIVGFNSQGDDSFSFVTWVELPPNETILFMDGRYDGGGDGSGEGSGGGTYEGANPLYWTNGNTPLSPGTVVVLSGLSNNSSTPSIGTSTGGFGLTNGGEQFFIAQGTIVDDQLDGDLIFGLDYEGTAGWTGGGESELPEALNLANANISFAHADTLEFSQARNTLELAAYPAQVASSSNWSAPSGSLSSESFQNSTEPPVIIPDQLGGASEGVLFFPKRLNGGQPIIDETWARAQGMTSGEASNINGPSCIALPSWLPSEDRADPNANYYLYFAHHSGDYIRMAWAENVEGPWTGFNLDSSLPIAQRGVLSLGTADRIYPGNDIEVNRHIASPQVLVDDVNQRFIMYYHGYTDHDGVDKGQSTIVATSPDGLNFNLPANGGHAGHGTRPVILGESYFRVFEQAGNLYALSNTGDIWESPDPLNPWTPPSGYDYSRDYWDRGPNPFTTQSQAHGWPTIRPRHFGVLQRDGILYAFLTYKEGRPERVTVSTFDFSELDANYDNWAGDFPDQELLRAEETWEGALFPPLASESGRMDDGVNQLRDPAILTDNDGRTYLFYCGQGEDALGVAQIVAAPQITGPTEVTTGQDETFQINTDLDVTPAMRKIAHASPVDLTFDAEEATSPLTYAGSGGYAFQQSATVGAGSQTFQLAHLSENGDETLTFPGTYYVRPGASFSFLSRLANSTDGQVARIEVSFDGSEWQAIWIRIGGGNEGSFNQVDVDLKGLEGRAFELRLRYQHDELRNESLTTGAGANQGWFIDNFTFEGLEEVTTLSEETFTTNSFTLDEIASLLSPHLSFDSELEDRFIVSVSGLHDGESTGYGKPFVIRVRSSYEDFLAQHFSESERADPLLAGLDADPEGDGLSNLVEHAFGTSPNEKDQWPTEFGLTAGNPALTFPWNPDASVRYALQMSTDLTAFEDILATDSITSQGELLEVTLEPDSSLLPLGEKAFFRLRVEAN
ncbi:hypothetical protein AAFN60_07010 [Roseibacillus persicicus]|uniref:hypothetical protein n=1 Tax=Roseibacillus persicicus TaxID=454148 RepID=UPI00398B7DBC